MPIDRPGCQSAVHFGLDHHELLRPLSEDQTGLRARPEDEVANDTVGMGGALGKGVGASSVSERRRKPGLGVPRRSLGEIEWQSTVSRC